MRDLPAEEEIRQEARYARALVQRICTEIGPGCPCSSQEHQRGRAMERELKDCCEAVDVEPFECSPGAFLGWFRAAAAANALGLLFFYLSLKPWSPRLFSLLAFLMAGAVFVTMVQEFFWYRQFIDRFYARASSFNVMGKIGKGQPKDTRRVIFFTGHHDSALQYTWLRYLKTGYYAAVLILVSTVTVSFLAFGLRFLFLSLGVSAPWLITTVKWLSFTMFPLGFVFAFFFTEKGREGGKVPGAGDNLSGCALAVAMGRLLKRHPSLIPEDTEIRVGSFGSEEAGLRGAKAYVENHLSELQSKEVLCVNFDTVVDPEIVVFSSDLNGFLKHSERAVRLVSQAAEDAGVPHRSMPFPFGGGGTDAAAFTEAGFQAVTLYSLKVPSQMIAFYHQEFDTPDKLQEESLENVLRICCRLLDRFEASCHPPTSGSRAPASK